MGALEREGRLFIVALLGCGWPNNRQYKWKDTTKLMEYALETYTYQELPLPETEIQIPVFHAVPENGSLKTQVLADTKTEEREPFQVLTGPERSDYPAADPGEKSGSTGTGGTAGREDGVLLKWRTDQELCSKTYGNCQESRLLLELFPDSSQIWSFHLKRTCYFWQNSIQL